jgi:acyl-CoA thioesterase I
MIRNMIHLPRLIIALCLCLLASRGEATVISRLNNGENLAIAAIGTSLTAAPYGSWFGQMGAWLDARYPNQLTYFNDAVPSSASKYTATYTGPASGLDVQLGNALAQSPDAVFIEFAMNDAYAPYGISAQMSKDNLQAMIDQINAWSANHHKPVDIIVQTMNNEPVTGQRPNLSDYYQGYRNVAAANHLLLVDHYPNWVSLYNSAPTTWHSYVPDGIHPNVQGTQNVIVPEIERALMNEVPEPTVATMLVGGGLLGRLLHLWRKRR